MIADILSRLEKVKRRKLPSVDYLRECFSLSDSGRLTWRSRPQHHFKTRATFLRWNSRYAGRLADVPGGQGYYLVCVDGVRYKSHRVVYAIASGNDPNEMQIDHINRNRGDNRPSNLRLATQSQNTMNLGGPRSDNLHGGRGVTLKRKTGKWEAWVMVNGKRKSLGVYVNKDDAMRVSNQERRSYFGEFFA